mmetsp:Transcript_36057/g.73530  ORF Transcript_36057/g.73530 Transcript_36057/m.73530 type:complete len:287 (+) Transcript_36057:90-950(+)
MAIKKQLRGLADPLLEEVVCGLEETLKDRKEADALKSLGDRKLSGDPLLTGVNKYHQEEHDGHPTKQLKGLADPLLEEVVCGLEETLKDLKEADAPRSFGDRTFSGDPLLTGVEKYHQDEHDGHPDLATRVALQEGLLLKRHKKNSLFANHLEGTYDPILQEYVVPHQALTTLIAFEEDIKKKEALFKEMAEQRRHNLESREVLLKHTKRGSLHHHEALYDPLLHEYVVPKDAILTAHAFEQDKKNKRQLFKEMSLRKRINLDARELFCDPLVHVYRENEIEEVDK